MSSEACAAIYQGYNYSTGNVFEFEEMLDVPPKYSGCHLHNCHSGFNVVHSLLTSQ